MTEKSNDKLVGALRLLPPNLRAGASSLTAAERAGAEELRLRHGYRPTLLTSRGEREFGADAVTSRDLDAVLETATGASVHAVRDTMRQGFVTVRGGYRVGIGGSVATHKGGEILGFRALSSLNIRIPSERRGVAERVAPGIAQGIVRNTLILSPPGAGKTTLLRDLVRVISDGDTRLGIVSRRVGLADERGEIAALHEGVPQLYVGRYTDVLDNCPKAEAVMMLVRVMNPEVVALDEVTSPDDVRAAESACLCGAKLIATAHADGRGDLRRRPVYRQMLESGVFETAVTITNVNGRRHYAAEPL